MSEVGRRIRVRGTVQGVGFRPFVYRLARERGIRGRIRNDGGGVTIDAFGPGPALESFEQRLRGARPPAARLQELHSEPLGADVAPEAFEIVESAPSGERRVSIPADLATCERCLEELQDPSDRRYRYPFINCTDCGPRFTIARDVPYDRAFTTMEGFPLCCECRAEYEDPGSRRFHAQPNACPVCGPRLALADGAGRIRDVADPLRAAARALAEGRIVALKGLGGFHLACDARSSRAVESLRARKRRDEKPFAVMVRDLAAARRIAHAGPEEARLLGGPERPIVLLARRAAPGPDAPCPEVAPRLDLLGVMLPYTPLHHLLLGESAAPLVMTSGNLSDEPIACSNAEALARLCGIADCFLLHDRGIARRCDDSVARVIAGAPVVLRRARGWVPRPIRVAKAFPEPVLACGGHLKNAVCIGLGDTAWLGPHVGDLETVEAVDAFEEAIDLMERLVGVRPEIAAHDLHPDYHSTRSALARSGAAAIGVQHHHAHVASAVAEHGLDGPVLGLAWDGTGYGTDGTAWGGELLLVDGAHFERLASFRPLRLAGLERAIREPWRLALAALEDAYDGDPPLDALPLFSRVPAARVAAVRQMLHREIQSVPAHGVGRWFDALGALALGRPDSRYEGQVALEWNLVADPHERGAHPFAVTGRETGEARVDLRALVRATVDELLAGVPSSILSARFHHTLVAAADTLVRDAARRVGGLPVVLSGGCFQNRLLTEALAARLAPDFRVVLHREVPPGDGGLALGQAWVAAEHLRNGRDAPCA